MDEVDYKSLILYYGREKYFHSMQSKSIEALTKFPANACFRLYNGFALSLGNRTQEGIRELNPMQSDKEYGMAATIGLIYAHKRCTVIDKEAISSLDQRLKEERKHLTSQSAYYAGVFLFLSGKLEKAKEYAEKALKLLHTSIDALMLKAWCELNLRTKNGAQVLDATEIALEYGKNVDAYLLQVRYHQQNSDYETATNILNHLSIRYPDTNVPLVEKMKIQLASWNWENAKETSARILNLEPNNIEALCIKTLGIICHEGKAETGLIYLKQLYSALAKCEPTNADLHLYFAQLFSRNCSRNEDILNCTMLFAEKAYQLSPLKAEYLTELGFQSILQGHYKEAVKHFRAATKVDDSSLQALCGLTVCQMAESGVSEQVKQQIEFLCEIQGTTKNPLLLYMSAKTIENNSDKAISILAEACEIHFKNLKTIPYGAEYLRRFDPDFLLNITNDLLKYSPTQSTINIDDIDVTKKTLHISLKQSLNILEAIVKAYPGSVLAVYQLAKIEFLCGEISEATATLQRLLNDIDPSYSDAHLLLAQIHIQQKHYQRANQNLETCLSHNFEVRDNPMYHLVNGVIKKNLLQFEDAQKSFQTALNICGVANSNTSLNKSKDKYALELSDRVTLYLQMIDVYLLMNQQSEAIKIMEHSFEEFSNTPEEGRIIIASADIALQQGKIDKVLHYLKNIQPGQPYYMQAKNKLAYVYLNHKKDRILFAQCFKELVEYMPGPESYLMLGDAYMSIQEPEEAINAFKMALRQNPSDPLLASKLGRAYVKTHQYNKAIAYYKEATMHDKNLSMKLDLAELFLKLKQFSNAEQTLIEDIESSNSANDDTTLLQTRTKQLLLLARIREKSGHLSSSLATLKEARDNQYRLQNRIVVEQSAGVYEQNAILSKICVLMAEQSILLRDNNQAIIHYREALKYSPDDIKTVTALARLHLQVNDVMECQNMCTKILKHDPNNEAASVMAADLSFRGMNFESAAYHFSQLLIGQPTYWTALARLVEVLRRSAALPDALPFLDRAEQKCPQPNQEAGLNYCKGLHEWYSGNPNNALRYFNNARRSSEWGHQAICNMVEICLNPDNDLPNESVPDSFSDESEIRESKLMALRTAERLLKELQSSTSSVENDSLSFRLLTNFHLMATRQKYSIETALGDFTEIAMQEEYRDHVGPILGLATAHILLKQTQKAKNQLKRVARNTWTFEDAEYLEKCWLMLAHIYIQANKNDMAMDLLDKVIAHNKSCAKAYELSAQLSEKDQIYRIAAMHYDLAWKYGGKSKASIGYKLAFNYMKIKRYADAIDVCQQVLKLHPDYTHCKNVLDKCRNNLRL
ncbi:tetratricopeptide repeat protein 21B-like [Contarinia nasturtii]|uniref:tetratricopeptide repeat protein 21B-like n=1 Tax=Contarinia nasturtii TaxID=265458 RepID=UPI0012D451DF|nr:tetratricopeptide repeat protein 21B-like [Contarinia nasturtii]XP_031631528.1 tetratricopeptide repeat protein 21B-like [Contarinia nasturtii]